MNELIFFSHLALVLLFTIAALKLGREALVASIAIQAMLANLFVLKQISLFGLHVTSCEVYTIGSLLAINLLQEYHPKYNVNRALLTYFGALFFFLFMAQFHLYYIPTEASPIDFAYQEILTPSLRIFLASIVTSTICIFIDVRLFRWLKERYNRVSFPLRVASSALIIQFLDTALFTTLGLWGSVERPLQILFFSYVIKVITIISMSSLLGFIKKLPLIRYER